MNLTLYNILNFFNIHYTYLTKWMQSSSLDIVWNTPWMADTILHREKSEHIHRILDLPGD